MRKIQNFASYCMLSAHSRNGFWCLVGYLRVLCLSVLLFGCFCGCSFGVGWFPSVVFLGGLFCFLFGLELGLVRCVSASRLPCFWVLGVVWLVSTGVDFRQGFSALAPVPRACGQYLQ